MQKVYRALGITFLFLVALSGTALGQGQQVSGTVTSSTTGEKLWGVTVRVKGTQTQTVTNQQGQYSLVAPTDAVLTYAQIGYRSKESPVNGQSTLDVTLEQAPTMLQEVVVTGYSTQRRSDITSAISSVNMETTTRQTSPSVLQRLDHAVPGVTVNNSGSPGSRSTVRIRGVTSFQNNDPLYVVDGTPLQDSYVNFLNPNDIGEMQVLKDASASSIYGSRASNGVVIIETKKGRAGGKSARLDVRTGVLNPTKGYDDLVMQDALQYFQVIKRSFDNAGRVDSGSLAIYGDPNNPQLGQYTYVNPTAIQTKNSWGQVTAADEGLYAYPNVLIMPASSGTNWWKAVFSPASFSEANLGMSGGGSDNSYNVSFGYLKQNGTAAYSQFQRGSLRVNTAFNLGKVTVGENVAFSREYSYGGRADDEGEDGILGKNILMQPVVPIYDIAGNYASGKAVSLGNNTNPLKYAAARKDDRNIWDRALGNAYATFDLARAVAFRTRFSFNLSQGSFNGFNPTTFENSEPGTVNSITQNNNRSTSLTWTNTLTYSKITQQHNLSVLLGQEAVSNNSKFMQGTMADLLNEDPSSRYIDDALGSATSKNVFSTGTLDRLLSFFGKADYNYKNRYYASFTLRRDGSSKFPKENQWGTFPAFNVGWRMSQEDFFPKEGLFSNLMLRFGWGQTGNEQVTGGRIFAKFGGDRGDTYYDITGSGNTIQAGFRQTALGNQNMKWETNTSTNVGADFEFLQGKANVTIDVYNRQTDDLLFNPLQPGTAGQAAPPIQNVGAMKNSGYEFALSYSGTIGANKVWSVALNGAHNKNEIVRIAGDLEGFVGPGGAQITRIGNPVFNQVGGPVGAFYGKVANGYYLTVQEAADHRTNSAGGCVTAPCQDGAEVGRIKFQDINGDGIVNTSDRTFIGSPHPDFTGGLDLSLRAGAWDFGATFFASLGADIYDAQKDFYVFRDFSTNVLKDRLTDSFCITGDEGCTNPGNPNAKYPRLNQNDNTSGDISSYFIEDGSYFRLKMLQVGWQVPPTLFSWLPSARVYLQGENLFTITGYPGLDPSLPARDLTGAAGDVRDQFRNVDVGTYPTNRTITVGISTTF
ncbi:MAG TPA: SusC/RagA family TonB-linked outer membrane protein [Gemmatimonadales bacterium]|nr:SusC/RagA family TonB-linked outer membrane protein [Gemmatimonadales bacterium]